MAVPHYVSAIDCLVLSIVAYLLLAHRRRTRLPYPPGPRPWPIIGNLLVVVATKRSPWAAFADMARKHGDIMCLRVFGEVTIVLCSVSAVKDLLDKQSEIYSDRPVLTIFQIMHLDWLLPVRRKGQAWRESRKLVDRSLRPGAISSYRSMIEEKTRWFLGQLLTTPRQFRDHIRVLPGKLVMSLTYGYDLKEYRDDDMVAAPLQITEALGPLVLPGAMLVNHFPFLRHMPSWVPWFNYDSLARLGRELSQRTMNDPINFVKDAMRNGTAKPSLAYEHLQELEDLDGPERQAQERTVKEALGSMFQAAEDTSISLITALFLALTRYPEVQRKAQAELDSVASRKRLPTFGDRPHLPYVEAFCRELLRWHVVTPLGVPHASSEDGVYRGFFIPKGSVMLVNTWGILHDPELFPEPDTFDPERFLDEDGTFKDDPTIMLAFGVGRRICPGRHFVDATLFMVAASVLSVFNVTRVEGDTIPVKSKATRVGEVVVHPEEFACSITPRDEHAKDCIVTSTLA